MDGKTIQSVRARIYDHLVVETSTKNLFNVLGSVLVHLGKQEHKIGAWAQSVLAEDKIKQYLHTIGDLVYDTAVNHEASASAVILRCNTITNPDGTTHSFSEWFTARWEVTDEKKQENTLTIGAAGAHHLINEILYRVCTIADDPAFDPETSRGFKYRQPLRFCDHDDTVRKQMHSVKVYFQALLKEAIKEMEDYEKHLSVTPKRKYVTPLHKKQQNIPKAPAKPNNARPAPAGKMQPQKLDFSDAKPAAKPEAKPAAKPPAITVIPVPETRAVSKQFSFANILKNEDKTSSAPPSTPEAASPRVDDKPVVDLTFKPDTPINGIPEPVVDDPNETEPIEPANFKPAASKKAIKRQAKKAKRAAAQAEKQAVVEVTHEESSKAVELVPGDSKPDEIDDLVQVERFFIENGKPVSRIVVMPRSMLAKIPSAPKSPGL